MYIVNKDSYSKQTVNDVNLTVVAENLMDIRVSSGAFKVASTAYSLVDDAVFTCTADPTYATRVRAFLAWDTVTSKVDLVVDEEILDGNGEPFEFDGNPHNGLWGLFEMDVPAAATDITSETIRVRRSLAPTA